MAETPRFTDEERAFLSPLFQPGDSDWVLVFRNINRSDLFVYNKRTATILVIDRPPEEARWIIDQMKAAGRPEVSWDDLDEEAE